MLTGEMNEDNGWAINYAHVMSYVSSQPLYENYCWITIGGRFAVS